MNKRLKYLIFFLMNISLLACNNTKHIPKNEKLYVGAKVNVNGPSLTAKEKKVLRSDLIGISRPKPNSKLLGLRVKLAFYNLFHNKKANSFWGKFRDRNGEPPAFAGISGFTVTYMSTFLLWKRL